MLDIEGRALNSENKTLSDEKEILRAKLKSSEERVSQLLGQQEMLKERLNKIEEMILETLDAD